MNRIENEVRADYITAMGQDLGSMFEAMYQDIVWLHSKWKLYRQLFADSPGRIDELNKAAGFAFYVWQDVLWYDVVLHLARLLDLEKSCGKENLSLPGIFELVQDSQLHQEFELLLEDVKAKCEFARVWRHKRLAHRDLAHALATDIDPLPGVSRAEIEAVLEAVRDFMNHINMHYLGSTVAYEHTLLGPGDGDALGAVVELGLRARREER